MRALVKTQNLLKENVELATQVGRKIYPEAEAELIGALIERDLPYYTPDISREAVNSMNDFQINNGLISTAAAYEEMVATQFCHLWKE